MGMVFPVSSHNYELRCWLDENDNANRPEAVEILSRCACVGADAEVIGAFEYEKGDLRDLPDFNVVDRHFAPSPYCSDCHGCP